MQYSARDFRCFKAVHNLVALYHPRRFGNFVIVHLDGCFHNPLRPVQQVWCPQNHTPFSQGSVLYSLKARAGPLEVALVASRSRMACSKAGSPLPADEEIVASNPVVGVRGEVGAVSCTGTTGAAPSCRGPMAFLVRVLVPLCALMPDCS